jgi:2-succinyl-5-enolpyruvyl-6-hydroxy-3-cyclohexene-1-carboxylate synthase
LEPDLILRVGGSPTSAALMRFLAQHAGVRQIVVDDGLRWKDHLAVAHEYLMASPGPLLTRLYEALQGNPERGLRRGDWTERWEDAESRTRRVLNERDGGELLEGDILSTVVETIPAGAKLLVASSMPIRDLDAFVFPDSKPLAVFGNRGASGIDGLVSTTLGLAVGSWDGEGGRGNARDQLPTVGVLGDLAFYHDMNGLLAVRDLGLPVVFVIINNDGGGIFETLPVRDHEPAFTRYFSTPHGLDFRRAAELYELPYARVETLQQLEAEITRALGRGEPGIVEVRTRRVETHQARRLLVETVTDAVEGLGQD